MNEFLTSFKTLRPHWLHDTVSAPSPRPLSSSKIFFSTDDSISIHHRRAPRNYPTHFFNSISCSPTGVLFLEKNLRRLCKIMSAKLLRLIFRCVPIDEARISNIEQLVMLEWPTENSEALLPSRDSLEVLPHLRFSKILHVV